MLLGTEVVHGIQDQDVLGSNPPPQPQKVTLGPVSQTDLAHRIIASDK